MRTMIIRAALTLLTIPFAASAADINITSGGATFPAPLYKRWAEAYQQKHPEVKINYEAQGSGFGIKGIIAHTLDVAGSDAPMSKKEMESAKAPILHIPSCAGAVCAAYNLPGFSGELKLTGPILADMYIGKISKWNDPKIAAINEGALLPDLTITPVSRSDGSGTNFVFTNYLATQSEEFKGSVGMGKEVKWPVGQSQKGNAGVSAVVQQTAGAVGYVELNYAIQAKLPTALLQNKDGKFVKASSESVSAAGQGAVDAMGDSLAVNIWNQNGAEAYPIASFTYLLVYKDMSYLNDAAKEKAIADFITWATHDGQSMAKEMDYAPLSEGVQKKVDAVLGMLKM